MKIFIALSLLLVSVSSFAAPRRTYIMTPNGPVRVVTPQDLKAYEESKKDNLKGVGQEFVTRAEVQEGEVQAFVRGCGKIEMGSQNAAEDASDEEKAKAKKLKTVKNGDSIAVRMETYGACTIKDWRKR